MRPGRQKLAFQPVAVRASRRAGPRGDWYGALCSPGPATMRIGFTVVDGVRIRYAESEGPPERTILLTSPWPESLYAFAPIWRSLARRFRLFAVDLPGFGASEAGKDLASPRAMGTFLVRLIDECELGRPHLVGPDIGTPAALFAAASAPTLLASLVVGSSAVAAPLELGVPLRDWVLGSHRDGHRSIDPCETVRATLETNRGHVPTAVRSDYFDSYAGERFHQSMRYLESYPDELPALAECLADIQTPTLIFSGSRDLVVPSSNGEFLHARLPNSRVSVIRAGHFVWEEAPDAFSEMISAWVAQGYRNAGAPPGVGSGLPGRNPEVGR